MDVEGIIEGLAARLVPLVTSLVGDQVSHLEARLTKRIDDLADEVRQHHEQEKDRAARSGPGLAHLAQIKADVAGLRAEVAGLRSQDQALASSLQESTASLVGLAAKATPSISRVDPPTLSPRASSGSLLSVGSQSASGLTTRSPSTAHSGGSWASRVAAHQPPPPPRRTCPLPGAATVGKAKSLGPGTLSASQLRAGQTFRGQVVKVLPGKRGGCFICFGDDKVRCDRDGFARMISAPDGGQRAQPTVGSWVKVVVRKVIPPDDHETVDIKNHPPRWRVDLGVVS